METDRATGRGTMSTAAKSAPMGNVVTENGPGGEVSAR